MPSAPKDGVAVSVLHDAVELIGRRWTGAIVAVLLQTGPLRFRQIAQACLDLSDRLLTERMRELEARGLVTRTELEVGVAVRAHRDGPRPRRGGDGAAWLGAPLARLSSDFRPPVHRCPRPII